MNEEEQRKEVESTICEVRQQIKDGEKTLAEGLAFLYGYVSQALMSYIGKFDPDITGGRK